MHVMPRLLLLAGLLLAAGEPFAFAPSATGDPIAPAVVGRPLDKVEAARRAKEKAAAGKRDGASRSDAKRAHTLGAAPQRAPTVGAAPQRAPQTTAVASGRPAKQAVDDRADARTQVPDDVGTGTHFARKPLAPGVYFGDQHRKAVRRYYAAHPASGTGPSWHIGEPVPRGATTTPPPGLLASLPKQPPGYRYVEVGGELVLMAAGSRMVVDGISRSPR